MSFERFLKIRHLILVRTLGRELSLRRTAEILRTSQSAVSRGLAEIELLLGERLFERTTRKMALTATGRSLVWHAHRILRDLEQAESDFRAVARGVSQSLHVGLLWGFSPLFFAKAVARFRAIKPDVDVRFHEGLASDLFSELTQDRVDFIVSHMDVPRQDGNIEVHPLYSETTALVVGPDHIYARREDVTLTELSTLGWILPPIGTTMRITVERELLMYARGPLPTVVECVGPHFVMALLADSDMVATVPGSMATWMQQQGLVRLPISHALPTWPICAAYRRSAALSDAAQSFLACLKEACHHVG